jgi:hypothetical protein
MLPNRTILGPDLFPIQMELIFGLKSPACLLFSAIPTHQLQTAFSYVPEGGLMQLRCIHLWAGSVVFRYSIFLSARRSFTFVASSLLTTPTVVPKSCPIHKSTERRRMFFLFTFRNPPPPPQHPPPPPPLPPPRNPRFFALAKKGRLFF